MRPGSIAVVVPLYDEVALVDRVVADIVAALDGGGRRFRLVLVDNGSTDGTGEAVDRLAAADPRLLAVHLSPNQGYGGGILAGLRAAWTAPVDGGAPADLLGWMWGDGQVDPRVLPQLAAACEAGADLAKVRRTRREDGLQRLLITRGYAALNRVLGVEVADVNGCPKLFRRDVLARLDLRAGDWFLDFEAVAGLAGQGAGIAQVDAVMRPRAAGRSKVRPATVAQFLGNLARWRLLGQPHGSRPLGPRCYQGDDGGSDER